MTKVTITIDTPTGQETYSRSADTLTIPLLCGAFAAAFAAHQSEAQQIWGALKAVADAVQSMGLGGEQ
jgi:hypothetical protein